MDKDRKTKLSTAFQEMKVNNYYSRLQLYPYTQNGIIQGSSKLFYVKTHWVTPNFNDPKKRRRTLETCACNLNPFQNNSLFKFQIRVLRLPFSIGLRIKALFSTVFLMLPSLLNEGHSASLYLESLSYSNNPSLEKWVNL